MKILVVDIGGTHVKVLVSGATARREFDSSPALTAAQMVEGVKAITKDWKYDAVSRDPAPRKPVVTIRFPRQDETP